MYANTVKVVLPDGRVVYRAEYLVKRERTGQCECGVPVEGHPSCEACGMFVGYTHECDGEDFRGHYICMACRVNWLKLDTQLDGVATWPEFLAPPAELRDRVKITMGV